jgi:hypothetical protein
MINVRVTSADTIHPAILERCEIVPIKLKKLPLYLDGRPTFIG